MGRVWHLIYSNGGEVKCGNQRKKGINIASCCVNSYSISKKYFRLGGMAPSQWTRSVRAVRDTPVADYSMPGLNTTRRVAYPPPIAVCVQVEGTRGEIFAASPIALQSRCKRVPNEPIPMYVHSWPQRQSVRLK
jgi:hypothetical protein